MSVLVCLAVAKKGTKQQLKDIKNELIELKEQIRNGQQELNEKQEEIIDEQQELRNEHQQLIKGQLSLSEKLLQLSDEQMALEEGQQVLQDLLGNGPEEKTWCWKDVSSTYTPSFHLSQNAKRASARKDTGLDQSLFSVQLFRLRINIMKVCKGSI